MAILPLSLNILPQFIILIFTILFIFDVWIFYTESDTSFVIKSYDIIILGSSHVWIILPLFSDQVERLLNEYTNPIITIILIVIIFLGSISFWILTNYYKFRRFNAIGIKEYIDTYRNWINLQNLLPIIAGFTVLTISNYFHSKLGSNQFNSLLILNIIISIILFAIYLIFRNKKEDYTTVDLQKHNLQDEYNNFIYFPSYLLIMNLLMYSSIALEQYMLAFSYLIINFGLFIYGFSKIEQIKQN